jgi:hypothetical protein
MTRSNGLGASSFVPVAEFSPGLDDITAQDLLDRLERVGVAAYLEPMAAGDMLLVDARRTRTAAALLTRALQENTDDSDAFEQALQPAVPVDGDGAPLAEDERVRWSELMADFDATPGADVWPTVEGNRGPEASDVPMPADGPPSRPVGQQPVADRAGTGQVEPDADAVADDFVPEPPPPLPRPTMTVAVGWLCATVIPLLVVVLGFVGVPIPIWALLITGGFFVYGLVILFGQLRSDPEDEDDETGDTDNGARV